MASIVEIITPAFTHELTTIETVRAELGVTPSEVSDPDICRWIQQASGQIAAYCNRKFGLQTVRERWINANFIEGLALRYRPVASLDLITEGGATLDPSAYYLDAERAIIYKTTRAPWFYGWGRELVVEYHAGYDLLDDLPFEIERACLLLVSQFYFGAGTNPFLRSEDIPGVASYSYGFGSQVRMQTLLPPEVEALLSSHKELCVA